MSWGLLRLCGCEDTYQRCSGRSYMGQVITVWQSCMDGACGHEQIGGVLIVALSSDEYTSRDQCSDTYLPPLNATALIL